MRFGKAITACIAISAWLAIAAWGQPAFAGGGSEIEADLKKLKKYAAPPEVSWGFDTRLVGRCVCRDSLDGFMNALGAITWVRTTTTGGREKIELKCYGFQYDLADGDRTTLLDCDEWFPLGR
jgi:hypothetical protein